MQSRSSIFIFLLIIALSFIQPINTQAQRNPPGKGTDDRIQKRLPNKTENPRPGNDETVQRERPKQTQIPKVKNPPPFNDEKNEPQLYHPKPQCNLSTVKIDPRRPNTGVIKITNPNYKLDGIQKYKDGDYGTALNYLSTAIEKDSNDYELYYYRGLVELKIQFFEEAKEDFTNYIDFYFYEPEGYFQRGLAKFYLNEKEEAEEDFLIAAEMDHKIALSIIKRFY